MNLRLDVKRQLDHRNRLTELARVEHNHLAQTRQPSLDEEHHPSVTLRSAVGSRDEDGLLDKTVRPRIVVLGLPGRVPVLRYAVETSPEDPIVCGAFWGRVAVLSWRHDVQPGYIVGLGEESLIEAGEFAGKIQDDLSV